MTAVNHIDGSPFTVESENQDEPEPPPSLLEISVPDAYTYRWRVRADLTEEGKWSTIEDDTGNEIYPLFHAFDDVVFVYCPDSVATCEEDTEGDGITDTIGNKSKPYYTLSAAIIEAMSFDHIIQVAERGGTAAYNDISILVPGIELYGGYSADNNWVRNIELYKTNIEKNTSMVIKAFNIQGEDITLLDGFYIKNLSPFSTNYVIYIEQSNSNLIINNCTINAGSGELSQGIYNINSSPTITNNIINGGSGSYSSMGIDNFNSAPNISNNKINGGTGGNYAYGIYNYLSSPDVSNNSINGGIAASKTWGVYLDDSSLQISDNIINGGSAGLDTYGIEIDSDSSAQILNNVIDGGISSTNSYGLEVSSNTSALMNNWINGGTADIKSVGLYLKSSPLVVQNYISGGSAGQETYGMYLIPSSSIIMNNIIDGGISDQTAWGIYNQSSSPIILKNIINSGLGASDSVGIYLVGHSEISVSPTILNNTIYGGNSITSSTGIEIGRYADLTITNNIIFTSGINTTYGILEAGSGGANPEILYNNAIFNADSGGSFNIYMDGQGASGDCGPATQHFCLSDDDDTTNEIEWAPLHGPPGAPTISSGNITLKGNPQQTYLDVFYSFPEKVYTADGLDANSTYDGDTTTLEVKDSTTCDKFIVGEYFEYFYDNTVRTIESTECTLNMNIIFSPALEYDSIPGTPILLWGTKNSDYSNTHGLKTTSPALNTGLSCPGEMISWIHTWSGIGMIIVPDQEGCDSGYPFSDSTHNVNRCESTYLHPAIEIMDDSIGNDNGLCESFETCIFNPNIGVYTGHGNLVDVDTQFPGCQAEVTSLLFDSITLLVYNSNGY
jgi:hypothetical protein